MVAAVTARAALLGIGRQWRGAGCATATGCCLRLPPSAFDTMGWRQQHAPRGQPQGGCWGQASTRMCQAPAVSRRMGSIWMLAPPRGALGVETAEWNSSQASQIQRQCSLKGTANALGKARLASGVGRVTWLGASAGWVVGYSGQ